MIFTKDIDMADDDKYEFDGLFGWVPKATEQELRDNWKKEAERERKDPHYVGQIVRFNGKDVRIEELCGKNAQGQFEYFIEYCVSSYGSGIYVTEREISNLNLPKVPAKVKEKCTHPRKYKIVLDAETSFWTCPDCLQEVDPPFDRKF